MMLIRAALRCAESGIVKALCGQSGLKLWNELLANIKETCTYLKLKSKHTYYLTTMSKIINKSCDYVV